MNIKDILQQWQEDEITARSGHHRCTERLPIASEMKGSANAPAARGATAQSAGPRKWMIEAAKARWAENRTAARKTLLLAVAALRHQRQRCALPRYLAPFHQRPGVDAVLTGVLRVRATHDPGCHFLKRELACES